MPLTSGRVALQLWTLRGQLQSVEAATRSLERVRELGYEHVELCDTGALSFFELGKLAKAAGLGVCGAHLPGRAVVEEPRRLADELALLGCRLAVYPQPHLPLDSLDQVLALADRLSQAGEVFRSRGQLLAYHNHALELRKLEGRTILDWLFERMDPFLVHAELDTYWIQLGGGDPAGYCARLSGRLPALHLKDYGVDAEQRPQAMPLGDGNLNLRVIVREAESAACDCYVVEQEPAETEPFAAIARSLAYLKA
jgi:sugar phosphate isomerase/epimerase